MKRSQMVGYMSDALLQFMPEVEKHRRDLIADVLLKEAEKYNMRPPFNGPFFIHKEDQRTEMALAEYHGRFCWESEL